MPISVQSTTTTRSSHDRFVTVAARLTATIDHVNGMLHAHYLLHRAVG